MPETSIGRKRQAACQSGGLGGARKRPKISSPPYGTQSDAKQMSEENAPLSNVVTLICLSHNDRETVICFVLSIMLCKILFAFGKVLEHMQRRNSGT